MCKNNDKLNAILAFNSELSRTKEEAFASDKPQAYFLDKHGKAYVRGNFPIGTIVNYAKSVPFSDVEEVKVGIHLSIPKIPINILQQVVSFFRDVCTDTKDEAFVRIYLDKTTNEYVIHCPKQNISGASVKYEITDPYYENNCIVVMDIHSHNTMGAFFSTTDDNDEKNPGQLFMVLGKLNTHEIAFGFRTFMDEYIPVDFFDVFEKPEIFITSGDEKINVSLSDEAIINAIFETIVEYPEDWESNLIKRVSSYGSFFGGSAASSFSPKQTKHYAPTNFSDDAQLCLFGSSSEYDSYLDEEANFAGSSKNIISRPTIEDIDDEDYNADAPVCGSIDADYEKGVDAGMAVTDEMEEQNPFFISGLIDGLEQAGILEDVIATIKKNGLI